MLSLSDGIGGLGVGIFCSTSVNVAAKWFPDERGLATGLVTLGFEAGAGLFGRDMSPRCLSWCTPASRR